MKIRVVAFVNLEGERKTNMHRAYPLYSSIFVLGMLAILLTGSAGAQVANQLSGDQQSTISAATETSAEVPTAQTHSKQQMNDASD